MAIDLKVGLKIGKLTIINPNMLKRTRRYIKCYCECNIEYMISIANFINQDNMDSRGRDCSCFPLHHRRINMYLNRLLSEYICTANRRKIVWELSDDHAKLLLKSDCFYCGCQPNRITHGSQNKSKLKVNGIDRIDSNDGYTVANSISCCKFCNYAKNNLPVENFLKNIKKIYENLKLEQGYNITNFVVI